MELQDHEFKEDEKDDNTLKSKSMTNEEYFEVIFAKDHKWNEKESSTPKQKRSNRKSKKGVVILYDDIEKAYWRGPFNLNEKEIIMISHYCGYSPSFVLGTNEVLVSKQFENTEQKLLTDFVLKNEYIKRLTNHVKNTTTILDYDNEFNGITSEGFKDFIADYCTEYFDDIIEKMVIDYYELYLLENRDKYRYFLHNYNSLTKSLPDEKKAEINGKLREYLSQQNFFDQNMDSYEYMEEITDYDINVGKNMRWLKNHGYTFSELIEEKYLLPDYSNDLPKVDPKRLEELDKLLKKRELIQELMPDLTIDEATLLTFDQILC